MTAKTENVELGAVENGEAAPAPKKKMMGGVAATKEEVSTESGRTGRGRACAPSPHTTRAPPRAPKPRCAAKSALTPLAKIFGLHFRTKADHVPV